MKPSLVVVLLALCVASALHAEPDAPSAPCETAAHHAFDFWLGEWEVTGGADGATLLGHNRIERAAGGCAIVEHWVNARGEDGRSINVYEPDRRQWTQFWIGSDGIVLRLSGNREKSAMVLRGQLTTAGGGVQLQRIRWSPLPDGAVEQRWDISDDDGVSWQSSFVGSYRRVKTSP